MQGLDINGPGGGGGGENSVYGTYGNQNDEDTLQHYTNNQTGNTKYVLRLLMAYLSQQRLLPWAH